MRNGSVLLLAGALALAGCSAQPPAPPDDDPTPTHSPIAQGTVEPVQPIPGLDSLGLGLATASVRTVPGGWAADERGLTYVAAFREGATAIDVVRIGLDGEEKWRETVGVPSYGQLLHPRISSDEGAERVAVWFSSSSTTNDNGTVIGDIRWFDVDSGDGDTFSPRRPDDRTRIESWSRIIGYVSFPDSYGQSSSFTYLDGDGEPVTHSWVDLLAPGEQSWMSSVTSATPSYSIRPEEGEGFRLRFGEDEIFQGGDRFTRWVVLPTGEHAFVGVPGSKMVIVDSAGKVLLDYSGDCNVDSSYVDGQGVQVWSGSLIYDVERDHFECLTAIGGERAMITGMTREGIALAHSHDGKVIASEPRYNTMVESDVEGWMWARGGHLVFYQQGDGSAAISVFRSADLRPR